jgi:hypothetical protein
VREELLLALTLVVAPISDEDYRARVEALVRNLLTAIPALEPQSALRIERTRRLGNTRHGRHAKCSSAAPAFANVPRSAEDRRSSWGGRVPILSWLMTGRGKIILLFAGVAFVLPAAAVGARRDAALRRAHRLWRNAAGVGRSPFGRSEPETRRWLLFPT